MTKRITKKDNPLPASELRLPTDVNQPRIEAVLDWMEANEVSGWRPGPFQVKVGSVNYYPTTGKIVLDFSNQKALAGQSLQDFVELVGKYSPSSLFSPSRVIRVERML